MFEDIETGVLSRLRSIDAIYEYLSTDNLSDEIINSDFYRTQKGVVFVLMYAALEFSLTQSVSRTLEVIEQENARPSQFRSPLLCTLLDPQFKALRECGPNKVWEKRLTLIDAISKNESVSSIDSSVFPSGGAMNISIQQIENVWKFFEIQEDLLPDGVQHFLISEIKDHRNAIAHGRETAVNIGRRFNVTQLGNRIQLIKLLSLHITSTFSDYCTNKNYFLPAA